MVIYGNVSSYLLLQIFSFPVHRKLHGNQEVFYIVNRHTSVMQVQQK